jgi:hypothetical protein
MGNRGLVRSKVWFGFKIGAMNTVNMKKTLKRRGGAPCLGSFYARRPRFLYRSAALVAGILRRLLKACPFSRFRVNIHLPLCNVRAVLLA